MTDIYVDGDACPVREEIYRVAARLRLNVLVVSNGSRPIRPPGMSNVSMVLVGDSADAADDWIAERIGPTDVWDGWPTAFLATGLVSRPDIFFDRPPCIRNV